MKAGTVAATTYIPIECYFHAADAEPDCEYIDGVLEERPSPEYDHSSWQGALLLFFAAYGKSWNVRARPELRVRVSPTRFRVPDVTVLDRNKPIEQIVSTPPLAIFEILSPEDRMTAIFEKLADYERMGIAGIWIIEPKEAVGYRYDTGKLARTSTFGLPALPVKFSLEEIAAFID